VHTPTGPRKARNSSPRQPNRRNAFPAIVEAKARADGAGQTGRPLLQVPLKASPVSKFKHETLKIQIQTKQTLPDRVYPYLCLYHYCRCAAVAGIEEGSAGGVAQRSLSRVGQKYSKMMALRDGANGPSVTRQN
ncbi:hypothetical protein HPB47_009105, partial [Ixodes persulcatus]